MQVIWNEKTPIATKAILKAVNNNSFHKSWNISTLQTLLNRLIAREYISSYKHGKEKYYTPIISKETYLEEETNDFLYTYYSGSVFNMMASLFKNSNISKEEIEKLKNLLVEDDTID